jgi:hypothetical protein
VSEVRNKHRMLVDQHYAELPVGNLERITRRRMFMPIGTEELEFLRPIVSRPVRLGIGQPFGTLDQILSCSSFFV